MIISEQEKNRIRRLHGKLVLEGMETVISTIADKVSDLASSDRKSGIVSTLINLLMGLSAVQKLNLKKYWDENKEIYGDITFEETLEGIFSEDDFEDLKDDFDFKDLEDDDIETDDFEDGDEVPYEEDEEEEEESDEELAIEREFDEIYETMNIRELHKKRSIIKG